MNIFWWVISGTAVLSLISLAGVLVLFFNDRLIKKIILWLVAFSAGALLAGALLEMIPESIDQFGSNSAIFLWVIAGFSLFFLLEQFIHWHHCHQAVCDHTKPIGYLVLIADSLHNFIDGIAIAGAFMVDVRIGVITLIVAALHEIPQELGDFGILIHSGWTKIKALLFNFVSGLAAILGGLLAYILSNSVNLDFILPFAAGNFIYIACSDLIPEVKHHEKMKTNIIHFSAFILGILLVWSVGQLEI